MHKKKEENEIDISSGIIVQWVVGNGVAKNEN